MTTETYNCFSIGLLTLTLVAGIATVVVYYRQLRVMQWSLQVMQDTLKAQNLTGLIQYLQAPDVRHARHVVLTDLKTRPYNGGQGWTTAEQEQAATACAAYGVAGVLVQLGRIDRDVIIENWGPSIRLVSEICQEFIAERRCQSGDKYWHALLWLCNEAKRAV